MSRTDINQTCQPLAIQVQRSQIIPYKQVGGIPAAKDVSVTKIVNVPSISRITRKGTVNPMYLKLLSEASLPPNNFSYTERTWSPQKGVSRITVHNTGATIYDSISTVTGTISSTQFCSYSRAAPSALIISNLENQSSTKARLKLKDQDVNLTEVWGERHESLNMIRENANRIGKTYAALRRGDFRGAAAALGVKAKNSVFTSQWRKNQSKAIANGWLELQYGWVPLISDVHGAVEALHKTLTPSRKNQLIRVSSVQKLNDTSTIVTPLTAGSQTIERHYEIEAKTCLYFRQSSTSLHTLSALGITNPLLTTWQLTKYSFIVDWFVRIGDFLSSIDASIGYAYRFGCLTTGVRSYERMSVLVNGVTSPGVETYKETEEKDEMFSVNRLGLTSELQTIALPTFRDPRSLQHTLNSIALLRQSFKR